MGYVSTSADRRQHTQCRFLCFANIGRKVGTPTVIPPPHPTHIPPPCSNKQIIDKFDVLSDLASV